jgi:ectoine hydroxylase-related dioxygenase (phytanoyl-CoA dioxygenase family)
LGPLQVKYDNKVGELSLFTPTLFHGVYKNITGDMRISMAIDVETNPTEDIINYTMANKSYTYYYIR